MKIYPIIACAFLFAFNCYAADLKISQGATQRVLTDKDLQQLHLTTIEIEDPVYNKHKRYAGYWLSEILGTAGIQADPNAVLVFTALDGYKARVTVADVINSKAKALVAVKDLDAPEGWENIQQGKELKTPAPYYLVWQIPPDAPANIKLPWPYQMNEISILNIDEAQAKLVPDSGERNSSIMRGYKIFQQNCIACHSLNLEGGVVGPELNIPRNILEYRDRKTLREFIANPSSFRARDKMPAFGKELSSGSIEDVLDYLAWMGKHKGD